MLIGANLLSLRMLVVLLAVAQAHGDWLVDDVTTVPTLSARDSCSMILSNGLISREFSTPGPDCQKYPNFATIDLLDSIRPDQMPRSALAALDVEAKVQLDGALYSVGGFNQTCALWQPTNPGPRPTPEQLFSTCTYLNRTQPSNADPMPNATAFQYVSHSSGPIQAPFNYTHARHSDSSVPWPPKGLHLAVKFAAPANSPAAIRSVTVTVHYEILQGIPAMTKWVEVSRPFNLLGDISIGGAVVETLRVNDNYAGTSYALADGWRGSTGQPLLYAEVDTAYGAACSWGTRMERTYNSNPYLVCAYSPGPSTQPRCHPDAHPAEVCPGSGVSCPQCGQPECACPAISVPLRVSLKDASSSYFHPRSAGDESDYSFSSFKVRLLLLDTTEQERRGLSLRRLTKLTQPWITENPLFTHLTDTSEAGIKQAVEDARAVGIEMIIQSFGTSFQMENGSATYLEHISKQTAYAKAYGVEMGGYDLIDLDRGGLGYDQELIGTDGKVGGSACFASKWVDHLVPLVEGKLLAGLVMVETDGPYGGGSCSATNHTHHRGLEDSVYWQTRLQSEFYQRMREQGVFVNAPDRYFSAGANKMMFYGDPTNFGRPRKMDLMLSRQMLYDNTFEWLPTQGWSLLPIENYGGGGLESAFAPLEANADDYDLAWAMYMGYGVSGVCWRGKRIFEGPKTKGIVSKWIQWYNTYRRTLVSEAVIHVRRPDGQSIDAVLHANPKGGSQGEHGVLFAFNPTDVDITGNISIPLYYTGLQDAVIVAQEGGNNATYHLQRDYNIILEMKIPANRYSWWVIW